LPETIEPKIKAEEVDAEETARPEKCVVCGEAASVNSKEGLCWICRRLKISAWSDSDNQAPVQE
jgi:ribosomal protein S14